MQGERPILSSVLTVTDVRSVYSQLAREVLDIAAASIRPGITTLEIDEIVHRECIKRDSYPSPLGYHKFPRSVCTSVNEVICHGRVTFRRNISHKAKTYVSGDTIGIPDARLLVDGDIINLDVTLYHGGFHGDINATCSSLFLVPLLFPFLTDLSPFRSRRFLRFSNPSRRDRLRTRMSRRIDQVVQTWISVSGYRETYRIDRE